MKKLISKIKIIQAALLITLLAFALAGCQKWDSNPVLSGDTNILTEQKLFGAPIVPDTIAVPEGNKVIWHCYATGMQIYQVTESTTVPGQYVWTFVAPSATLYMQSDFTKQVGTHYAGPTWKATIGPKKNLYVVGTKLSSVTEDATAVPWLLLQAVPNSDPGYFSNITFIQRLYTTGGLAPTTGATADNLGEQQGVPYTAEYYFYGAK